MNNEIVKYETGATSHAVNDLILFTDNTRELAELRDSIYEMMYQFDLIKKQEWNVTSFDKLFFKSADAYRKLFPNDSYHILMIDTPQMNEYCQLYLNDFDAWKSEHGYK